MMGIASPCKSNGRLGRWTDSLFIPGQDSLFLSVVVEENLLL